ncbi:hypothetical protein ACRE1S_03950 [Helicobacter himalayensis]
MKERESNEILKNPNNATKYCNFKSTKNTESTHKSEAKGKTRARQTRR